MSDPRITLAQADSIERWLRQQVEPFTHRVFVAFQAWNRTWCNDPAPPSRDQIRNKLEFMIASVVRNARAGCEGYGSGGGLTVRTYWVGPDLRAELSLEDDCFVVVPPGGLIDPPKELPG
ncbi:MAG: hypothetical protein Q8Q14_07345 [Gemmatimonadales bacterium]|nr:hypothetical protein [Gemmatimonadales bacterium]